MRARRARWVQLVLAIVGSLIAGYLTLLHYNTQVPLTCVAQGGPINCADVLGSAQSMVAGIPVAAWGLGWFLVMVLLSVLALRFERQDRLQGPLTAWSTVGALTVVYLVYVEFDILHAICFWCSVLHLIILAILGLQVTASRESDLQGREP